MIERCVASHLLIKAQGVAGSAVASGEDHEEEEVGGCCRVAAVGVVDVAKARSRSAWTSMCVSASGGTLRRVT